MYIDDIKLFSKNEKELETLIHAIRIYSQDIGMEVGIEKCAMLVMKSDKRHMTDGTELPKHDKNETLGKNESCKYLGILEADTSNKWKWKTRFERNISGEQENSSRQNSPEGTSPIKEILRLFPSLDIQDPSSSRPKMNINKGSKNKKTNDHV